MHTPSSTTRLGRTVGTALALLLLGSALPQAAAGRHPDRPFSIPPAADSGRPVVILVHGRGQLPGDSTVVRAEWMRTLRSGAERLLGDPLLKDGDVWLAWYADALDPLTPIVCADSSGFRGGGTAGGSDPGMRPVFAAVGEGLTALLDLFDGYARDEARAIAGDLLFLGDSLRKCAGESRLAAVLARAERERRPVVLVAHSFGSLLTYGYLRQSSGDRPAADIRRFVTIGSLLGATGARDVLLGDTARRVALPVGVQAWTNIVDSRDALAHPIPFEALPDSTQGENLVATSGAAGADPHDAVRYLRDPVTLRTVFGTWCAAFDVAGRLTRPAHCSALQPAR